MLRDWFAGLAFLSAALAVQGAGPVPAVAGNMAAQSRTSGMFRWWMPAAFVDEPEIDAELQAIAAGGFKGVEICVHMGDASYTRAQAQERGWATPRWKALYKHILVTANRLGLQVDTTITPAWPAAVPSITPDSVAASRELIAGVTVPFSGRFSGEVPAGRAVSRGGGGPPGGPPAGSSSATGEALADVPAREDLVAVTAARLTGSAQVTKTQVVNWGDMPYNPARVTGTAKLLDPRSLTVVHGYHRDANTGKWLIDWQPPDNGTWVLFGYWMRGTKQEAKEGPATFAHSYVVDHYGRAGAQAVIDFWNTQLLDDETRRLLRANGGSIFEDSLEVDYAGLIWTPRMLDEFRRLRGYDLTPLLPLLNGSAMTGMANVELHEYELDDGQGGASELGERVRRDFGEVLTSLYIGNHIRPIQDWARSLGLGYRGQAYGSGFDMVATAAAAVGPDGESLGFGPETRGDDRFRMVAGGMHLAGRRYLSDEVGAIANKGYRLTWLDMLQWIDKNLAAGANQMIFHGFPYARSNSSRWPGYSPFGFGLAGYWGPREPHWNQIQDLAGYLARTQGVLQAGQPRMDVVILNLQYGTNAPVFADPSLADAGYTYDIVSPDALANTQARVTDGLLAAQGPGYRALILDQQPVLPAATARQLLAYAKGGLKIVVVGAWPAHTPWYRDAARQDGELAEALAQLRAHRNVVQVSDESRVADALRTLGVQPALQPGVAAPLRSVRRQVGSVNYYFVHNESDQDRDAELTFTGAGEAWQIDPWTGVVTALAGTRIGAARFTARLHFVPYEATLVAFGPLGALPGVSAVVPSTAEAGSSGLMLNLDGSWQLSVERWEDAHETVRPDATRRSTLAIGETLLQPWKGIPALGKAVSGIGTYTRSFTVDAGAVSADACLSLGAFGGASARAWLNGRRVPLNLFTGSGRLGSALRAGTNEIRIEVATNLGNQLIADGAISAPAWNPDAKVDYENYGLLGPVSIGRCGH